MMLAQAGTFRTGLRGENQFQRQVETDAAMEAPTLRQATEALP